MLNTLYAYCHVPVAPLRANNCHRSEQVSQLLFGEKVHLLSPVDNGWVYVSCQWDHYCGWVKESQIAYISKKEYSKKTRFYCSSHSSILQNEEGAIKLPLGASLYSFKKGHITTGDNQQYKFKGKKLNAYQVKPDNQLVLDWAIEYLGAPYIWGGRTTMGIDCSGLSQMVYKMLNISLPRDAYQQAEKGQNVDFLLASECGDLAFFDNAEGKIIHVGILLNNNTIIHATESSGCVVIDRIDAEGIISKKLKVRTHQLRLIKRFL